MPTPIMPVGFTFNNRGEDIVEAARNQDTERRIEADNRIFEETGINPEPIQEADPLVDNDVHVRSGLLDLYGFFTEEDLSAFSNDINNAMERGGDRELQRMSSLLGDERRGYAEDSPTNIIEPSNSRNRNSFNALHRQQTNSYNSRRQPITAEQQAYLGREEKIKNKEENAKIEENKKKFNNSIIGLEV